MADPVLNIRPEKTIDGIESRWNAARLPIQYEISNTKWPTNSEDSTLTIQEVNSNNGYAEIIFTSSGHPFIKNDYIKITGTTSYNGVHRVIEDSATDSIVIDFGFIADETGSVQKYYNNYTTLVRVYAGLPYSHPYAYFKEYELIGTIEQRPDDDNITYVDIRKYIAKKLSTFNDIDQSSFPLDINIFCGFYIDFAERYDISTAGVVSNFTSDYGSDFANPCYASHSALQFRNQRGGNMFDYTGVYAEYREQLGKFLTLFSRPTLFEGQYFDLSIIIPTSPPPLKIEEYDINDTLLTSQDIEYTDDGEGVYRLRLDELTFNDSTKYLKAYLFADIPLAPSNLTSSFVGPTRVDLSWTDNSSNEDSFTLQYDTNSDFSTATEVTGIAADSTSYSVTGLLQDTLYYFRIKATGTIDSDWSNTYSVTTPVAFEFTISGSSFTIPTKSSGSYSFVVDWDSDYSDMDTITSWNQAERSHTYGAGGAHSIRIWKTVVGGAFSGFAFQNTGDKTKMISVQQWGCFDHGDEDGAFYGCTALNLTTVSDAINYQPTNMNAFFTGCTALTTIANAASWDVSLVTDMDSLFTSCTNFNESGITSWDTGSVTTMFQMFRSATSFNQNIDTWDVSSCTAMNRMFESATSFNQSLDSWDVSSVTTMYQMFLGATSFNSSLDWVLGSPTLENMFVNATSFNGDITGWNTGSVANMRAVFNGASAFNQDISGWNTSSVTTMHNMFRNATSFNQDISGWNVGSVTTMFQMFSGATSFDQDLGGWDIQSLTDATNMLKDTTLSTANYDALLSGWGANTHNSSVTFNGGNATYSAAPSAGATGRGILTGDLWMITDNGPI